MLRMQERSVGGPEDNSFAVIHEPSNKRIICADTGNGGDTAYQLLRPCEGEDNYHELGYAATHSDASRRAQRLIETDLIYASLLAFGYPICDGTYLIAICEELN